MAFKMSMKEYGNGKNPIEGKGAPTKRIGDPRDAAEDESEEKDRAFPKAGKVGEFIKDNPAAAVGIGLGAAALISNRRKKKKKEEEESTDFVKIT